MFESKVSGPIIIIDRDDGRRTELRNLFSDRFRVEPLEGINEIGSSISKAGAYIVYDEGSNFEKLLELFHVNGFFLPVILYSENTSIDRAVRSTRDGAMAYFQYPFGKSINLDDLMAEYERDSLNISFFQRRSQSRKVLKALTSREADVLMSLCEGLTGSEVAEKLGLSPKTVDSHRTKMLKRLGVNSLVAVRMAAEAGWTLTSPPNAEAAPGQGSD